MFGILDRKPLRYDVILNCSEYTEVIKLRDLLAEIPDFESHFVSIVDTRTPQD